MNSLEAVYRETLKNITYILLNSWIKTSDFEILQSYIKFKLAILMCGYEIRVMPTSFYEETQKSFCYSCIMDTSGIYKKKQINPLTI